MITHGLNPPIEAWGQQMNTLEDAAYVVRKYAIESANPDARKLVRFMRDAETVQDAMVAERRLRAWIRKTAARDDQAFKKSPPQT